MKTQDAERWRAQKAELGQATDTQSAQAFVAFVEDWCTAAEKVLGVDRSEMYPIEALRATLAPTEASNGYLSVDLLANMLLLICANWEHGDEGDLFETMTEFEQRLVATFAGLITDEMQASAEGGAVPDESMKLVYGQMVPTTDA